MKNAVNNNLPILALLGIVFVTLKLCGIIDWSWWWVTLPFYAPLVIALAVMFGCGVFLVKLRK